MRDKPVETILLSEPSNCKNNRFIGHVHDPIIESKKRLTFAPMAGLYIHIPFCRKACHYCNFHFSTQLKNIQPLVDAICLEIAKEAPQFKHSLSTLYFGGGSPSILSNSQLTQIFEAVAAHFEISQIQEITLEANPEDMIQESLQHWKSLGVNRLSVGIQSLNDDELEWMNRAHTANQAIESLETAREIGFDNFSIDLIYGSEKKSLSQWQQELQWVNSIGVNHLSCYALTIEENTPFGKWAKSNKLKTPPDEHAEEQFLYLSQWAAEHNWEHYEISNLSKAGHQAIHNSNYWAGLPYLGIGPSAHSYNGKSRRWNLSNNALYISGIQTGAPTFTEEILSNVDVVNELLLTQLRLTKGVNIQQINLLYPGFEELKRPIIEKLIGNFQIVEHNGHWSIPSAARFLADAITVELMLDEN